MGNAIVKGNLQDIAGIVQYIDVAKIVPQAQRNGQTRTQHSSERDQPEFTIHPIILFMKYIVIAGFVAILGSLGAALFFMMKGGKGDATDKSANMARALAMRVGFSVLLFVCVLIAWKMGYIQPTGIPAGQ